ncbi:hypothetical protein RRG08_029025 [Elysia crispata]|uniref:C-type lectin domain-containing protein n=1 Tax=Elysia crispata TaxID=231223 RepID=A0AAE1AI31_9GAST|nr:hypothetical protein RRG08_029025 [Elysia crispata]
MDTIAIYVTRFFCCSWDRSLIVNRCARTGPCLACEKKAGSASDYQYQISLQGTANTAEVNLTKPRLEISRNMKSSVLLIVWTAWQSSVSGTPSGRTVYNLHTRPAHWASARATCAGYDAHLVSVESAQALQADLETLDLLDWDGAFQRLIRSGSVWTGLHRSRSPDGENSLAWDSCTTFTGASSPNGNIRTQLVSGPDFCTSMADGYLLEPRSCDQQLPFICQLDLGQCWFLPLEGQTFSRGPDHVINGDIHDCAQSCRNTDSVQGECWGFLAKDGECELYIDSSGHAFVRDPASYLVSDSSSTAHVKICTGGWLSSAEPVASAVIQEPQYHNCSDSAGEDWNPGICYCSCQTPPNILSPDYLLSSAEEKAEQISSELLVNPTKTSKAHRKLSSADDQRASAKSVGSLGIILLTLVFGGLVALDLNVLCRDVKHISSPKHKQSSSDTS